MPAAAQERVIQWGWACGTGLQAPAPSNRQRTPDMHSPFLAQQQMPTPAPRQEKEENGAAEAGMDIVYDHLFGGEIGAIIKLFDSIESMSEGNDMSWRNPIAQVKPEEQINPKAFNLNFSGVDEGRPKPKWDSPGM